MGKKKKIKKQNKVKKIIISILLILLVAILVYAGIIVYKAIQLGGGLQGFVAATLGHDENTKVNLEPVTCLLVGKSQNLTDTIIVAKYDPKTQEISMLSIPRDTYIGNNKNTATAFNKINAMYQLSPQKLLDAVNSVTGLNIKNYIVIDTKALREVVDAIGGVYFDVPIDMDYDDSSQKLYIHLEQGYQLLDGDMAEQLVRFRKNNDYTGYSKEYGSDDYGRMRTQREFIVAALKQTMQAKNIFKLGEFIDIFNDYVTTNMDLASFKDYLPYLINVDFDEIQMAAVPGVSEKPGTIWIFVHDKKETEQLVGELFLGWPTAEEMAENTKYSIDIMYVTGKLQIAEDIKKNLTNQGYNVTLQEVEGAIKTRIINRTEMSDEQIKNIKKYVNVSTIENGSNNGKDNITIMIGNNYME